VLVGLAACTLKEEAELVLPRQEGRLFLEGYLSPGAPIKLTLIRSSDLQQDLSLQLIWNARAELVLPTNIRGGQGVFTYTTADTLLLN
jgi:hypothetical protein